MYSYRIMVVKPNSFEEALRLINYKPNKKKVYRYMIMIILIAADKCDKSVSTNDNKF